MNESTITQVEAGRTTGEAGSPRSVIRLLLSGVALAAMAILAVSLARGTEARAADGNCPRTGFEKAWGVYPGKGIHAVDTEYGPVQVKITVASGKITKVAVTQVPMSSGHDQRINSYAVPLLNAAAQKWQTSDLQSVSGATITSEAYKRSLQSAIDKAHL